MCGPGIILRQQERHMRYALNIFISKHIYKKKKEKVSGWHKGYYYTHVHCICILS